MIQSVTLDDTAAIAVGAGILGTGGGGSTYLESAAPGKRITKAGWGSHDHQSGRRAR